MASFRAQRLFKQCNSYERLNELMLQVVKMELPNPMNFFVNVEEATGPTMDSEWWGTSERWNLLVKINEAGLITTFTNEGEEHEYKATQIADGTVVYFNYRCALEFIMKKERAANLIAALRAEHFIVKRAVSTDGETPGEVRFNITNETFIDGRERQYTNAIMLANGGVLGGGQWEDVLNSEFLERLKEETVSLIVIDPFYNKPAHSESGVLTRVLYHATQRTDEADNSVSSRLKKRKLVEWL
jgi:hypothetical protein